jgi:hypothetical protein
MQKIIDILKSRGKLGAWLLIVLGLGIFVTISFGKIPPTAENYALATGAFGLGLSNLGIRSAQDPK